MAELLYGLILAGGKSSRMGQDKGLVPYRGVAMLRRVGLVAQSCTDRVFIITPWGERYQNITHRDWTIIPELEAGGGAMKGLHQGLAYFGQLKPIPDWVLLLACDLPCLDAKVLQNWRTKLKHLHRSCLALVPKNDKGWEPLCAFYRRECLTFLEQSQTRSFQEWLKTIPIAEIDLDESTQAMLKNCNTPQDLVI